MGVALAGSGVALVRAATAHAQLGAAIYNRGTKISVILPSDELIVGPRATT